MNCLKRHIVLSSILMLALSAITVTAQEEAAPDSAKLAKELEQELGLQTEGKKAGEQEGISQETRRARQSFFQNMNPNISVVGDARGSVITADEVSRNVDIFFNEAEFAFQAAVDPYAKADFFLAIGKHAESPVHPPGMVEEEEPHGGFETEIEEAFITILSLPANLQLKAGKFRLKFGKINETHPHAYDFIGIPLMYNNFFGGEGLNDEGASLSWLLPHSLFFQELTFQVTSGPGENASYTRAENNRLLYLGHLKNFFDLNESTTLELGVTGLTGPNNQQGTHNTGMFAADLTVKWKPLQRNRYKSFEFKNEFVFSGKNNQEGDVNSVGFYSHIRYQFARRWFIGGLFDYSEYPDFSEYNQKAFSGILQFFISEFQKFEMQYTYNDGNFFDAFNELRLRGIFVIGAHGAHQY